jgi:hypothetical protein
MARVAGGAVLLCAVMGSAEHYWIDWEGEDWPENMNPPWDRNWGNWQGQYQGGAYRTLEDGILIYDSLYDPGVFDGYEMERPGEMDPSEGLEFIVEWRLKVDEVTGWYFDPTVGVQSDDGWGVALAFGVGLVVNVDDGTTIATFAPGVFHSFQLRSTDMRT